jgi:hypothetical protein
MKKVFLALAVVTMIFSATSCNKQKKCQCVWEVGNVQVNGDVFLADEGKDCDDYEETFTFSEIDCHRVY